MTSLLTNHDTIFVGGEWVPSATRERIDIISPVSEEVLARGASF